MRAFLILKIMIKSETVFLLKEESSNFYKVGSTNDLNRRLIQLSKQFKTPLLVVFSLDMRPIPALEALRFFNATFKKYKVVKGKTKWFAINSKDAADFKKHLKEINN